MPIAFIVISIALQAVFLLVSLAVAAGLGATFGLAGASVAWFTAVFIVLAFAFVPATIFARKHSGRLVDWCYRAAAYWFGLANFLLGGAVAFHFSSAALYASNMYVPPAIIGGICFGAIFLIHLYGTIRSGHVRITSVTAELPGLPPAWRGKKIAFVSDLHLGCVRGEAFAAQVARKIGALQPEIMIIGGDLYDGPACDEKKVIEPLRALAGRLPKGAYFVTGNHEYFLAEPKRALDAIRAAGIRILDNEAANIEGLRVAGVDFAKTHRREEFRAALASPNMHAPAILVKHEPTDLDIARDAGVTLGLFGHTHRGQVWPLSYLTYQIYKSFDYGYKSLGSLKVCTSSGAGTWGPPLRLGTKSEIVSITLK